MMFGRRVDLSSMSDQDPSPNYDSYVTIRPLHTDSAQKLMFISQVMQCLWAFSPVQWWICRRTVRKVDN